MTQNLQDDRFILDIYKQQQLGENVDFLIRSGKQKLLLQSAVVRSSSSYLRILLESSCICDQPTVLILDPSYASILDNFVSILYTGFTDNLSGDKLSSLFCLLSELGFENLLKQSSKTITKTPPSISKPSDKKDTKFPVLEKETSIKDPETQTSYMLSFPKSRCARVFSLEENVDPLHGFERRVQIEYNSCPVGPFVGPFDQNESLNLNLQLPNSNLTFEEYSEFVHPKNVQCKEFALSQNYLELDDLEKIHALEIKANTEDNDEPLSGEEEEEVERIVYTCIEKKCKIPCVCSPCSTHEEQCKSHSMKHLKLFDEKEDAMAIRSSEEFCKDETFFSSSYLVKYSGIPTTCSKCRRDLIHHKAYHISFHENCKFCIQNWFKLRAKSKLEFNKNKEMEEHYLNSVCPYCNKKFCEPYFAKKHIEYEHGEARFLCENCSKSFQSKQAFDYHKKVHHSDSSQSMQCSKCEKEFKSRVALNNHVKYVHSDIRRYCCKDCDLKFKQKKHLREHYLNVHKINQYREEYHQPKEVQNFFCGECGSQFKRKMIWIFISNSNTAKGKQAHYISVNNVLQSIITRKA